jgi:hypothetical protein
MRGHERLDPKALLRALGRSFIRDLRDNLLKGSAHPAVFAKIAVQIRAPSLHRPSKHPGQTRREESDSESDSESTRPSFPDARSRSAALAFPKNCCARC